MRGSGDKSFNTRKANQDVLHKNARKDDLQLKTDHFQRSLYGLRKYGSENDLKIAAHKKEFLNKAKVSLEQRAQAIMRRHFGDITKLLADFEKQGVRLPHTGESSSNADTPLSSQKYSEESIPGAIPDEFVRALYKTHTSAFKRVFGPAFEQARQKNQSEGDALLQVAAHAHRLAYNLTSLRAQQLAYKEYVTSLTQPEAQYLQEVEQELDKRYQELDSHIKRYEIEHKKAVMQREVPDFIRQCTEKFVRTITEDYIKTTKERYLDNTIANKEQVNERHAQLSRGEYNYEDLTNHIKATYKLMKGDIGRHIKIYSHERLLTNLSVFDEMYANLAKITNKYVKRGIPIEDAQKIMAENLPRLLEENAHRLKDEYPNIISECGIAVINFDESQFLAD